MQLGDPETAEPQSLWMGAWASLLAADPLPSCVGFVYQSRQPHFGHRSARVAAPFSRRHQAEGGGDGTLASL